MVFTRKKFVCGASAAMLSVPTFMRAIAAEAATENDTILILLTMGGGNDGFNNVIPLSPRGTPQYANYMQHRPTLAVSLDDIHAAGTAFDANVTTPAGQASEYAFHPKMTAFRRAYSQGRLAVVMGCGLPLDAPASRSHPNATFAWMTGAIDKYQQTTLGWVGMSLDQFGTIKSNIVPMINAGGNGLAFGSAKNSHLSFYGALEGFYEKAPFTLSPQLATSALNSITTARNIGSSNPVSEVFRSTENLTAEALVKFAAIASAVPANDYILGSTALATPGAASNIKTELKQVARMLLAGNDAKVYGVGTTAGVVGTCDTHSNQLANHPGIIQQVSEAMVEFMDYMEAKNPALAKRILFVQNSEFGRSVGENSTGGTDHGTSSVHFVMGGRVKGGVYGEYPSFNTNDLLQNYQAKVPYDYRNYLSDIIAALGADPSAIVGKTYPKFGFI